VATEPLSHGLQRLARLARSLASDRAVVEILPDLRELLEVDYDRSLLSMLIDHELNTFQDAPPT